MTYDILVKDGEVIDPSQGIHAKSDVGIVAGKIAAVEVAIPVDRAKQVIDAKGKLVVPGLIDVHAHPCGALLEHGVDADELGIQQGVTTICDGGSLGCANFRAARAYINSRSKTDVFWFIHGCNIGQIVAPEIHGWHEIDAAGALRAIEKNRDIIRGVKFRAIGSAARSVGLEGAKAIKGIAREAGLPLMVHLGICYTEMHLSNIAESVEPYTKDVLRLLERGDVITHIYSPKIGGVIKPDGSILREFREAIDRGVILDVAHGGTNFGLEIARLGIANGIIPHTISTDAAAVGILRIAKKGMAKIVRADKTNACPTDIQDPAFGLVTIMSKFMALGLTVDQVIEMTTINPARVLSEERHIGSLRVGTKADVTLLQPLAQDVVFPECTSDLELNGKAILLPALTLKSRGREVDIVPSTRN